LDFISKISPYLIYHPLVSSEYTRVATNVHVNPKSWAGNLLPVYLVRVTAPVDYMILLDADSFSCGSLAYREVLK
jgi:hypothetical protein